MYDLPEFNSKDFKSKLSKILQSEAFKGFILIVIIIVAVGFLTGKITVSNLQQQYNTLSQKVDTSILKPIGEQSKPTETYVSKVDYEQAIINTVKSASPSVVSIVISKNVPIIEQEFINPFGDNSPFDILVPQNVQKGTKYQEVGAGSGFIVSEDGLVLTNKHVVLDKAADYTVFTNSGKKYTAKVLARDPVQDLAIIKIQDGHPATTSSPATNGVGAGKFPAIKIGDSDSIQIGQGAIAIGNALGAFRNTVSVGIISGLGRTISASGSGGFSETLEDVIQTDAAINSGNSGGPLLNLKGEVVGVNVAKADGANSIGFAIPINVAKRDINQIIKTNTISYPFLGVRYLLVDQAVKEKYSLAVDYGALVIKGENGEAAITKDSAAAKAGLKEKDVILEFNGEKITKEKSMTKIIAKYSPGDKVNLKVLRDGKEINIEVTLGERS